MALEMYNYSWLELKLLAVKTNYAVFSGKFYYEVRIIDMIEGDEFQGSLSNDKNYCNKF